MPDAARTPCRTPAEGRDGVTNIPTWKFDLLRQTILDELATGECRWSDLTDKIRARLSAADLERIGKLGWHVVTVKLEMEVRGDIRRTTTGSPQILTLN